MKRFSKIFAMVAAVAGTLACTTDATEDFGVKVGGKTQLTLSLDGTRTQLGTKDEVKNIYPLTWSENDQISVNGVASDKLTTTNGAGTASATFAFVEELTTPYFIAYPAVAEANQVEFAATQYYSSNTSFENGVATMYAYSEDGKNISLNHLTGVLKIGISKGDAVIKSVRISTVDRKPIAGTFEAKLNATSGEFEFTPVEGATSDVITYYFDQFDENGDGLNLAEQEGTTYIYVAVPAVNGGVYNELYVTLYDNAGGVMYATVGTNESKPLSAGNIREFSSDITYTAIDKENIFVLADYSDMDSFKVAVEAAEATLANTEATDTEIADANATLARKAVVVADIDMSAGKGTADAWKSINAPSYTGEFNGNGYAFLNLSQPLFEATAATIKGVHLKGVNITETTLANLGALVCSYTGTSVTHCSAEGKIAVTNASMSRVSGLVAHVPHSTTQPFTMTDCVNDCAISIVLNTTATFNYGGCLAQLGTNDNYSQAFTFSNNVNNAAISISGTSTSDVNGGGVVSYVGFYKTKIDNCHNHGDITIEMTKVRQFRLAGVVGRIYNTESSSVRTVISNCSNTATVSVKNTTETVDENYTMIGGCLGQLENYYAGIDITNCDNSGNVLFDTTGIESYDKMTFIGGVLGFYYSSVTLENCDNTAEKVEVKMNGAAESLGVGGVLGLGRTRHRNTNTTVTIKNCTNEADITATIAKSGSRVYIGGITGWIYGYQATEGKYVFEDVDNYGSVKATINDRIGSKNVRLYLGGILGGDPHGAEEGLPDSENAGNQKLANCQFTRCYNYADKAGLKTLYVKANNVYEVYSGGIMGAAVVNFTMTDCANNLPFKYEGGNIINRNFYGGLVGKMIPRLNGKTTTIDGFTNNGDITIMPTDENEYSISGGIAYCDNASNALTLKMKNMTNNGNISVTTGNADGSNYTIKHTRIAGLYAMTQRGTDAAKTYKHEFTNLKNFGDISLSKASANNGSGGGTITVGGALGLCYYTATASNLYSNCDIYVTDCTSLGKTNIGALVGGFQTDVKMGTGNSVGGSVNGVTLTEENYLQYVFSGSTAETCGGVTWVAPIVDTPAEE